MSRKRSEVELGHDAFLDIVANLVGILIILVVVLGAQSTAVIQRVTEQDDSLVVDDDGSVESSWATEDQLDSLATYSMQAAAAQADSNRFEQRIKSYDAEIDARKQQRAMLLDLLSEAESAWAEKKKELDQQVVQAAQQQSKAEQLQSQLQQVQGEHEQLSSQPETVVAVAHLPTPMAKTVFGTEIHFRLKNNRLSLVPVDKLLKEIGEDFRRAISARDGRMDAAVGPIQGYVASYVMDKDKAMVARGGQVGMTTRIQLVGVQIAPLEEPHGQTLDQVFSPNSDLQIELAGRNKATTTITVWVYPDSFAAYRKLKEYLYVKGFATAARPLPAGQPITGSPQGSRSNAQ